MWENETVVLVVSLKKRILGGANSVRFGKIALDDAIPPFVKLLFQNRVEEYLIRETPLSFKSTPHFDLRPEDIERFKTPILESLREIAIFSQEEVEEILQEALVLRLEYLIKPVSTIEQVLFEKTSRVAIVDLEKRLYPYAKVLSYTDELIRECKRLGYPEIEKDEYQQLMGSILEKKSAENPLAWVLCDFSVLTEFLSETKGEEVVRVEGNVLKAFFEDRKLIPFRRVLEVEMKLGKEDFDAGDLEVMLKRYLEFKETFAIANGLGKKEEKISMPSEKTVEAPIAKEEPEIGIELEKPPKKEEAWDLELLLGEESQEVEKEPEPLAASSESVIKEPLLEEPPKVKKPMRIIRREVKEEPLEMVEPEQTPVIAEEKAPPSVFRTRLKDLIDEKTEKAFIKKLFGGDGEAYVKLMRKLEEAESWRVAKILIDNELFKRDVDPFSREAIKLVDLVYSRYYPEEGVGGQR